MTDFSLIEIVYTAIQSRNLIVSNQRLLVGVSGGTDSLALLHVLMQLRARLPFDLHVATLDHGLRGEAGAEDARFVVETAQAWGLPVTAGYIDVGTLAREKGIGIEAAARIARYDFLASVAHEVGAERIAVAHNADDQVETILLHLLRGSGLKGLSGMDSAAPLPGHPDLVLIRPLLTVPRADLAAYCLEYDLQPCHDASNEDVTYTRNRLRHEIIPHLREITPQLERHLRQLGDMASLEDDFADFALHAAVDSRVSRTEGRISLPNEVFFNLHPALERRFVVWALRLFGGEEQADYRRVQAAVDLALRGKVGARAQFRGGLQLRLDYHAVIIERAETPFPEDRPLLAPGATISVAIPGITPIDSGWVFEASLVPFHPQSIRLAVPEGMTSVLRGRREGDRIALLGLKGHTQKLSKWMNYWKVPLQLRERVPLLVIDDEVAVVWWRPMTIISQHFAVIDSSARVVYFKLSRNVVMDSEKEVR